MGSSWVAEHFFSLLDMGLAALCLVIALEALPIAVGGYLGAFGLLAFIPLGLVTMAVQRIKRSEPPRAGKSRSQIAAYLGASPSVVS